MSSSAVQCGYIGLGAMGKPMAGHIANKLASLNYPPLLVFNRTQARAEDLKKTHPVKVATSLEQVARTSDVIFSCLLNDTVVIDTVQSLKPYLKSGTVLVESSTISPAVAKDLAIQLNQIGVTYLACPVMGPPVKAASAELLVLMAGGSEDIQKQVLTLLVPVIGKKAIQLGFEDVGKALRLKLCGNYFVTGVIELLAEGLTLGEAAGVGQDTVKDLVDNVFGSPLMSIYADRMLNNTYRDQIAFPLSGTKKDVNHIIQMANDAGASLPVTMAFIEHAKTAQEGEGDLDISSIVGGTVPIIFI